MVTTVITVGDLEVTSVWPADQACPSEIHIKTDNPRGVTFKGLRSLTLGAMAPAPEPVPEGLTGDLDAVGDWLRDHAKRRGTNQRLSPEFMAHVALFYTIAVAEGMSDPSAAMADYSGSDASTMSNWITRARAEGYLTGMSGSGRSARATGSITTKALEFLS